MRDILSSENPRVDALFEYLLQGSGKMLRPRLVYQTAALHPHDQEVVRDIAVAVELIHMASLVHDDIIDHSPMRRGRESLNARYGNHASVLTGDYLFAAAFQLINQHRQTAVMDNITRTIQIMCSGEILQMDLAYDVNISQAEYTDKTYRKTACLFASSCKTGALVSEAEPAQVDALEQYGLCLGYAYQIIDDVLDMVAEEAMIGKPVGSDLSQGNITLPAILAMKKGANGVRLRSLLAKKTRITHRIHDIIGIITASGAVSEAIEAAGEYLARGLTCLETIPWSPAREELQSMTNRIMDAYAVCLQPYQTTTGGQVCHDNV